MRVVYNAAVSGISPIVDCPSEKGEFRECRARFVALRKCETLDMTAQYFLPQRLRSETTRLIVVILVRVDSVTRNIPLFKESFKRACAVIAPTCLPSAIVRF